MINESSLKYPVAEYLTGLEMPLTQIQLEFSHPELKKRQIDLVTTDSSKNNIENAFEFKIARLNTKYEAEQKRIFNDLMRLHLIASSNNSSCYFIIAGSYVEFIQSFRSICGTRPTTSSKTLAEPEGFYTEWFGFKLNETIMFDVEKSSRDSYNKIYKAFIEDYKHKETTKKLALPSKLTTKCIAISAISRDYPTPYLGGIWKIE